MWSLPLCLGKFVHRPCSNAGERSGWTVDVDPGISQPRRWRQYNMEDAGMGLSAPYPAVPTYLAHGSQEACLMPHHARPWWPARSRDRVLPGGGSAYGEVSMGPRGHDAAIG